MTLSGIFLVSSLASTGKLVNVTFIAQGSVRPLDILPHFMVLHEHPFTTKSCWVIMYLNPPAENFLTNVGKRYKRKKRMYRVPGEIIQVTELFFFLFLKNDQ